MSINVFGDSAKQLCLFDIYAPKNFAKNQGFNAGTRAAAISRLALLAFGRLDITSAGAVVPFQVNKKDAVVGPDNVWLGNVSDFAFAPDRKRAGLVVSKGLFAASPSQKTIVIYSDAIIDKPSHNVVRLKNVSYHEFDSASPQMESWSFFTKSSFPTEFLHDIQDALMPANPIGDGIDPDEIRKVLSSHSDALAECFSQEPFQDRTPGSSHSTNGSLHVEKSNSAFNADFMFDSGVLHCQRSLSESFVKISVRSGSKELSLNLH